MNTRKIQQSGESEISLFEILLFLKLSCRNVILFSGVCLFIGAAYYLAVPRVFEASVRIQVLSVAGKRIQTPEIFFEKIKSPSFFSMSTFQACQLNEKNILQSKFLEKVRLVYDKQSGTIFLSTEAHSAQEALACLSAVVGEIENYQNKLASLLIEQKKQQIVQLNDLLYKGEVTEGGFPSAKVDTHNNHAAALLREFALTWRLIRSNDFELTKQIQLAQTDLLAPQTVLSTTLAPAHLSKHSNIKRAFYILGLSLGIGTLLGLLTTGLGRTANEIRLRLHNIEV